MGQRTVHEPLVPARTSRVRITKSADARRASATQAGAVRFGPAGRTVAGGPGGLLALQRQVGNAAVTALLSGRTVQRAGTGTTTAGTGTATAPSAAEAARDAAVTAKNWDGLVALMRANPNYAFYRKIPALNRDQLLYVEDAAVRADFKSSLLHQWFVTRYGGVGSHQMAAGGAYGKIEGKQGAVVNGNATVTPKVNFAYPFEVTFKPNLALIKASEIAFIQTIKVIDPTTGLNVSPKGTERLTVDLTKVDRLTGKEQGWYGMTDTEGGGGTLTVWKPGVDHAYMRDTPSAPRGPRDYHFEAAAVCRAGPDVGKVYAVVTYGFTVDANLVVTPKPHKVYNKETKGFDAAAEKWNEQAQGLLGAKNAPGQKLLPASLS